MPCLGSPSFTLSGSILILPCHLFLLLPQRLPFRRIPHGSLSLQHLFSIPLKERASNAKALLLNSCVPPFRTLYNLAFDALTITIRKSIVGCITILSAINRVIDLPNNRGSVQKKRWPFVLSRALYSVERAIETCVCVRIYSSSHTRKAFYLLAVGATITRLERAGHNF